MSIPSGPGGDLPGDGGGQPVTIITTNLPVGNIGSPYFSYLLASGGYSPYTWSLLSGSLPGGLSVDDNGSISGTPTTAGTFSFSVLVTDEIGGTDSANLSIQIDSPSTPIITTTILPPVQVGDSYNQTIEAIGGVPPYVSWTIIIDSLPPGLSIDGFGVISGTATTAGTYNFVIEVEDSNLSTDTQALSILVQSPSPTIITSGISDGVTGISYSDIITATGGTIPYVNWERVAGELPDGLFITSSPTTATISGTPTEVGIFNFTIQVTDSASATDTQSFSFNIYDGAYPIISTNNLPFAPLNVPYSANLIGAGGALPYIWSIETSILPPGLNLDESTGLISGIPNTIGSYVFTVKLIDANLNTYTKSFSLVVGNFTIASIITKSLPNGVVGTNYSTYVQGAGGTLPYSWGVIGTLPTSLSIDIDNGLISGNPTVAGIYSFSIILQDDVGNVDTKSFTIEISDGSTPIIITTSLNDGDYNIFYSQQLLALGGIPGYTWAITSGIQPPGLTFSTSGILSGVPTIFGLYNFEITVTDSDSETYSQEYSILIRSTGYDSSCCFCIYTNEIINFNTNSIDGILKATGGSILNNSQWQAPSIPGNYNVSMEVEGINGLIIATNTITVIEPLKIINAGNIINDLLPGDSFQLETNYPAEEVTWETVGDNIPVITPSGNIIINSNVADKCFGSLELTLRGSLRNQISCNLSPSVDIKLSVNPVYPTPDNCGPDMIKWLRETKDFRVIKTEFEGGCDETHIRNKVPTIRWTINYDGLPNYLFKDTVCPSCQDCISICGCDETNNLYPGCHPILKSSNRLDDFWNLVYGEYKSFTLVDHDTGEIWYNVKFDDKIATDHRFRRRSSNRTVKLVWRPCCNKNPQGGVCSKHGIYSYKPPVRSECPQEVEEECNPSTIVVFNNDDVMFDDNIVIFE